MITNLANLWAAQGWLPRFPTPARALHAGGFYRRESCHCPGLPRVGAWTSLPKRESISTCFDMDLWPLWVPEQIDDAEVPQLEFWTADGVAIYTAWGGSCWCPTVQDGAHCPGASRDLCNSLQTALPRHRLSQCCGHCWWAVSRVSSLGCLLL